ncbi:mannose-6-phosphate isomerase, class I [Euzebya tangerina]|uniref:mannose-6-phosphate isomerase, class I n=1 Tax=Euzebya tangerina TaxID=591198 RepID=UPI000E30D959|nr:mannose-6-phosphate isomerase, class I [Euzebya tangerina]
MDLLDGAIKTYHWGRPDFIPRWLGREPDGTPHAELWFGAHSGGPSVIAATGQALDAAVAADPSLLRPQDEAFPFLAKILAAGGPLSIQVHPDDAQAAAGFERENAAEIPRDASERTYRDPHAKPELICALTPFSALCGFRELADARALLALLPTPRLDGLRAVLASDGGAATVYRTALKGLFSSPPDEVAELSDAVAAAAESVGPGTDFDEVLRWTTRLAAAYPGDVGVIVGLLLNLIVLQPGQALFLGAGTIHSYLDGVGVEVMGPSDNVVRAGLTSKHIDTAELLALLDTQPSLPDVQTPAGRVHSYQVPGGVFGLTRLELVDDASPVVLRGPGILLVTEARLQTSDEDTAREVRTGEAVLVGAEDTVTVSGRGTAHFAHAPW